MRRALLKYAPQLHHYHQHSTLKPIPNILASSTFRFFSSDTENSTNLPESITTSSSKPLNIQVEDVNNKELKARIDKYFKENDEEAIPLIFQGVLARQATKKHEETDDELMDEMSFRPIDDVKDKDFESDFEELYDTDEDIDNLYDAQDIVRRRMVHDEYFNMDEKKWDEMIQEGVSHGHLQDMTECEQILEDMLSWDKLLPVCPTLTKIPRVLVIHGEGDGTLYHLEKNKPANWVLYKPPLPISYGTHHSKAMLLVYPRGLRVVIHTSNLIYVDWNNKSQGLWMQDFPWKDETNVNKGCAFENDLIEYLSALKLPEFSVNLPVIGNVKINSAFFKKFDYSSAVVRLIASVPGYHNGPNLKRWGHMKLRTVLQECVFGKEFQNAPIAYQFSSLGSLDEKWMDELASSMSSGFSHDKKPLGLGKACIIWPTVEDVRCSLEGYGAGSAIPSPQKNVEKLFLKKYWAKWKASHTGRSCAMPHIKTFTRFNGQNLAKSQQSCLGCTAEE